MQLRWTTCPTAFSTRPSVGQKSVGPEDPSNLGLGGIFGDQGDLAPDGVDERQLAEWERGCAQDMRKARPIQVKTFEV